jgi:exopolyphosphatase/guanosine-5'-triphosphate,3'-diphosphate pyrophosphatase
MGRVLSTVDIGSNTAHLLVGDVEPGSIRKICDESEWLSLGEVVGRQRSIPLPLQEALITTLSTFQKKARDENAELIYVFATEAIRRAANGAEVLKRVQQSCGLKVEVITPQREAELGLRGTLLDSGSSSFLLVEVGGGSAQVSTCTKKRIRREVSLPLGTGTLIAQLGLSSPCDYVHLKRTQRAVQEALECADLFEESSCLVACGGVARGLWRALHPDGDRKLHLHELDYLIWATQRLTVAQITQRFQVKQKRASTLLPGAVVFKQILERAGQEEMTVSRYGVREGALLEMAQGKVQAWPV